MPWLTKVNPGPDLQITKILFWTYALEIYLFVIHFGLHLSAKNSWTVILWSHGHWFTNWVFITLFCPLARWIHSMHQYALCIKLYVAYYKHGKANILWFKIYLNFCSYFIKFYHHDYFKCCPDYILIYIWNIVASFTIPRFKTELGDIDLLPTWARKTSQRSFMLCNAINEGTSRLSPPGHFMPYQK